MSVKSRTSKINKAAKSVIILNSNGNLDTLVKDYRVTTERLESQTIKFGQVSVRVQVRKTHCQCRGNQHQYTNCYHVLAALQESYRLAGFIFSKINNNYDAEVTGRLGGVVLKLISDGGGVTMATVRPNPHSSLQDAFDNLQQLLKEDRINLVQSGHKMPIARGVELYRRNDGMLAFKSGMVTSKPIVIFGRDWNSQNITGQWKLTSKAEKNWQEFLGQIRPIQKQKFSKRVDLLRGEVEEGID